MYYNDINLNLTLNYFASLEGKEEEGFEKKKKEGAIGKNRRV
jgi:hypothetical protein